MNYFFGGHILFNFGTTPKKTCNQKTIAHIFLALNRVQNFCFAKFYTWYRLLHQFSLCLGSSLSRVSSSSPSSTTPTEVETGPQSYHSPAHATSSEIEDEAPPPVASRPERTKSIVSLFLFFTKTNMNVNRVDWRYIQDQFRHGNFTS